MSEASPRRVLLKISGEALSGEGRHGVDPESLGRLSAELAECVATGVQIAIVTGAGNYVRGATLAQAGFDRVRADSMGMLGTVLNGLALQGGLENRGIASTVFSAVQAGPAVEPYYPARAIEQLAAGRVAILAGGTGNPYFTTDTTAALRAVEIHADCVLKGTKVDGVFSADPVADPTAERFEEITYGEVLERDLGVMDLTAITLSRSHGLPIVVFDMFEPGNLCRAVVGEAVGTRVVAEEIEE